jgi:hypothetical protein
MPLLNTGLRHPVLFGGRGNRLSATSINLVKVADVSFLLDSDYLGRLCARSRVAAPSTTDADRDNGDQADGATNQAIHEHYPLDTSTLPGLISARSSCVSDE